MKMKNLLQFIAKPTMVMGVLLLILSLLLYNGVAPYSVKPLFPVVVLAGILYLFIKWFIMSSLADGEKTYFKAINEGMLDEEIKYLTRDQYINHMVRGEEWEYSKKSFAL